MLLPSYSDGLTDADVDAAYPWPGGSPRQPWLRANMVATVDGATRGPDGLSGGISGDADRRVFGRLRGLADVVLAGASTVRAEGYGPARPKPDFAGLRTEAGQRPSPTVAVVSRSLALDLDSALFTEAPERTVVVTCASSDASRRATAARVADVLVCGEDAVDLAAATALLADRGLVRVHAEGGPHLLAGLAAAGLLDELLLTVSPMLVGGSPDHEIPRLLAGVALPHSPRVLRLAHLLEEDGWLFTRWLT